jgi:phage terminase large subunit-like protein
MIGAEVRKVDRQVILPNGGEVTVRSADNPDSLRGEGLDFVVMDECAFMSEAAWTEAIRPALSDRQGGALFISTPKGRNFFWRLWTRGEEEDDPNWKNWRFPTSDNPYIPQTEIDAAQANLPERIFQQEYLAEFLEDGGGIFRRVRAAATATERETAEEDHEYILGVDWGKFEDFTVITVLDATTNEVVAVDRFNQIDYRFQLGRLDNLVVRFDPSQIVAESNSMGEPLIEQLLERGYPVQPFLTTNASKKEAVEALALAFERGDIRIPDRPILINELQAFEATRLPSGMLRYAAPEGLHDDCVLSLCMAWHGVAHRTWLLS